MFYDHIQWVLDNDCGHSMHHRPNINFIQKTWSKEPLRVTDQLLYITPPRHICIIQVRGDVPPGPCVCKHTDVRRPVNHKHFLLFVLLPNPVQHNHAITPEPFIVELEFTSLNACTFSLPTLQLAVLAWV